MTKNPLLSQIIARGIGVACRIGYKTQAAAMLPTEDLP
jgi:hypothetical protein